MPIKKNIVELTLLTEEEYSRKPRKPLLLVCDNVRSMQNVGSMLRTCDAFNVGEAVMCGITATPPHAEISKTALGAERTVVWRYAADAFEEVKRLKSEGVGIAVLEQVHDSVMLHDFDPDSFMLKKDLACGRHRHPSKWALIVGNEVTGVDQRIVDIADVALEIPMEGVKHSLNVSVSAGIALWHIARQLKPSVS